MLNFLVSENSFSGFDLFNILVLCFAVKDKIQKLSNIRHSLFFGSLTVLCYKIWGGHD